MSGSEDDKTSNEKASADTSETDRQSISSEQQTPEYSDHDEFRSCESGNSSHEDTSSGEDSGFPRHVYFQSKKNLAGEVPREAPRENPQSELERANSVAMPHRPSLPYIHDTSDITDTQVQDQGQKAGDDDNAPPSSEAESGEKAGSDTSTLRNARRKIRSVARSLKGKATAVGELIGRPASGEEDLQTEFYDEGLKTDRSARAEKKHKDDEEEQEDEGKSSFEAHKMVRDLTRRQSGKRRKVRGRTYPQAGMIPITGGDQFAVQSSSQYRSAGEEILHQLTKLNRENVGGTGTEAPQAQGKKNKQDKWYKRPPNTTTSTLVGIPNGRSGASTPVSSEVLSAAAQRRGQQAERRVNMEEEIRVTVRIAEIICRQQFIIQLCRALMRFGAPTHRLEEYMQMTAKVLDVESQFLYLPGCMIMSFDDPSTRSTEVKLVRVGQGIDLARLSDTHLIYKNVIHDVIGIEKAVQELDDVMRKKPRYPKWFIVLVYGLATATFGPFAFYARPIDMPIIFLNGLLVGMMQHLAAPRSVLYSNVFEVTSTVVTSFLARAFGSIPLGIVDGKRQYIFCFSAIAQSSIALILPGFLVLCSSLELQSHQIIAGSIRMVYAIIFSLFLGYGMTVGTTIYGLMDSGAVSDIQCPPVGAFENPYIQRFPFVALVTVWLLIINQGKWKQLPPMMFIALSGYVSNYFSTQKLGKNSQVANSVGAFAVGILGNLYSRLWHGHAATAILPAIFILVPSGLAATGSLISGVQSAEEIKQNITSSHGSSNPAPGAGLAAGSSVFSLGLGMIQVAIGITIGLFLAALVVYPFGKRRSGLFSF
ncbi:Uncharacterized protein PECH_007097 [Penicillium ucsense]|uniref:Threonine/serine exporter-like N-terminal domain-containing protein n=1 Tax=Penicillium ucsense TaxID=2839758 RepID=A0A8J8W1E1_9EURO|nr:Uncharacterized protein PECM_006892 [Penicillium ucsense]KAF7735125.1 Uncharacterized protein PECH_007097 [Penicillium ucsense]